MKPTRRQVEIAAMVAHGMSDKAIAKRLSISVKTVQNHVHEVAKRMPGDGKPRHRLTVWFLSYKTNGNSNGGSPTAE